MTAILKAIPHDPETRKPVVHHGGEREWFETILGEKLAIRVHSSDVGGRYTIVDSIVSPLAGTPLHIHREDEIFEILEGTVTFMCAGERIEASAGAIVVVPAGAAHAWANMTMRRASMRVTLTPGGIEEMFKQIQGKKPDELEKLAAEYGTTIVGPPL